MASAGLGAVGRHRLAGPLHVDHVFDASIAIGRTVRAVRERLADPERHHGARHTATAPVTHHMPGPRCVVFAGLSTTHVLVALVSESEAQPIINTGTLYS